SAPRPATPRAPRERSKSAPSRPGSSSRASISTRSTEEVVPGAILSRLSSTPTPEAASAPGQHGLELAALVHLPDDVAAADELTADVELRDGRPARVLFDALADGGVGEEVHRLERDLAALEDLDHGGREAALG